MGTILTPENRLRILKMAHPLLVAAGKLELPRRRMSDKFFYAALEVLRPGHVIVTRQDWALTNKMIPGFFTHAAMFIGYDEHKVPQVIEAIGAGVQKTGLTRFLFSKDYALVLEPIFCGQEDMLAASRVACSLEGQKYDYEFRSGNKAWYCSEVDWYSYDQIIRPSPFQPRETWGVKTVTPEDFALATGKWKHVLDSRDQRYG